MPRLESAFQADRQRETVAESSEAIAGDKESGLRGPLEIGRSERGCEASRAGLDVHAARRQAHGLPGATTSSRGFQPKSGC